MVEPAALLAVARAFDPARLTQARRVKGISKTELHRLVGVSAAAVGQYERGEKRPRPDTVSALATALGVPAGYFAYGRPKAKVEVAEASFRRLRSTSVAQQQQATAYVEQAWELSLYLEQRVEFPELDLPAWASPESQGTPDPITAAQQLRKHWGLDAGPIAHLVYEIEQHGILTVFFSMKQDPDLPEKSRIDAFSTTALPRPIMVLTPDKANDVLRHRFSAAHELGHIVMHHGRHGSDVEMERQADVFAAEFLTPRDVIRDALPTRLNLGVLERLSEEWGVSVQMLLRRSRDLERISDSTVRRGYITLNTLPRRPLTLEDVPSEKPELLRNAIELLDTVGVSLVQVARDVQMTPRHVRRLAGIELDEPKLSLVREQPER
ncbi:XRE family transcriptional regulator [Microbacterium sp. p3-SID336]|uniref:XRE family transcriptional regulator n=1 Tax=Microbacterium sp. p3-SID336 TaxID=2916212 RepID=UPI0021A8EA0B|nr:XRE family transcriptional regulator [Microbacterium sp. p3-SID336]MCT1479370.1 XRE family transcriptional regulator [Microbacterium sp. p3-SID336]